MKDNGGKTKRQLVMTASKSKNIRVIDSHTGGEPTRLIVSGGPDLGNGPMSARLERFRDEYDAFRSAVVNEPRGSDVMVGALLCEPVDRTCAAGVIFFNNVGYLGMCGHGTIGLIATLSYMGRIGPGEHRVETPVGTVSAILHQSGEVTVNNVPSYRIACEGSNSKCPVLERSAAMSPGEGIGFFSLKIPARK